MSSLDNDAEFYLPDSSDTAQILQNGSIRQHELPEHDATGSTLSNGGVSLITGTNLTVTSPTTNPATIIVSAGNTEDRTPGLHVDIAAARMHHDESELFEDNSPAVQVWMDDADDILSRFSLSQQVDKILNQYRYVPKVCYTVSIASIVFLAFMIFYCPWLLPYYYTVSFPLLMLVRLVMYIKLKYQYFMLDLCYFVNAAMLVYIWAFPAEREFATVLLSFTSGPVSLATIIFRNSMVLHSLDKMTSVYLHSLPMFVSFVTRWYPEKISPHWHKDFVDSRDDYVDDFGYMAIWLWGVPMAFHVAHMFLYLCLIRIVFRPGSDHDYSFTYLSGLSGANAGCPGMFITLCHTVDPENIQIMYCVMTVLYGAVGFVFTPLWYHFYPAHCLFMVFVLLLVTWNGSTYYLDVFGPKVFK